MLASSRYKAKRPGRERQQPCHSAKTERDRARGEEASKYHTRLPMPQYQHLQPGSTAPVPAWDQSPPWEEETVDEITAEYLRVIRGH
jgi:hypothetical protein